MTSPNRLQNGQSPPMVTTGEKLDQFGERSARPTGHNSHHPVAEFLYQLTKMLTDDNSEIIEWSQARIKVHHPERLEAEVLHKYFRHSKFASFQRQLNYFGFRKIAGKGKMSPCSYVNDAATDDIRSLLLIKRKTNGSAARKAMMMRNMAAKNGAAALRNSVSAADETLRSLGQAGLALQGLAADVPGASGLFQTPLAATLSQQQLQRKALGESLYFPSDNALAALAATQNRQAYGALGLPHLNGQLQGIAGLQNNQVAAAAAAMSLASSMSQPATAAMNAAAAAGQNSNLFESSQLSSLVNEQAGAPAPRTSVTAESPARRVPSQALLNRLPSSNGMFPNSVSNASISNLLGPGRISSLLSLSSFLSRDPSLVDLLAQPGAAQFPAVVPGMAGEGASSSDNGNPPRPGNGHK